MKKIACLGPEGTHSYLAATCYLKQTRQKLDITCTPFMHEVLSFVETGKTELGIVPVENMIAGNISETLDFLVHCKTTKIIGELVLDIQQDLVGVKGTDLAKVESVVSHPQPLDQCMGYIRKHLPQAEPEAALSTVTAMQVVAQHKNKKWVAIGSSSASKAYGLVTLAKNISDVNNNQTRFLILEQLKSIPIDEKTQKISIVFSLPKDQPGGLHKILGIFAEQKLNLTKIESRPSKDVLGSYYFFIDLAGDYSKKKMRDILANVKKNTDTFKILGAYKEIKPC